jgi:carboxypeptidase PM20D1
MERRKNFGWRILKYVLIAVLLLIIVLVVNTVRFDSKQQRVAIVPAPEIPENAVQHFQKILQFKTITYDDSSRLDTSQFNGMRTYVEQAYPLVHRALKREVINQHSLLFHWKGQDSTLNPIVFIAHMDVVPVEQSTLHLWKAEPFAGVVLNDSIWGRGSVDDKVNVVALLESIEKLLRENFHPKRSVYLVFGHDEEAGGRNGARAIAALLEKRNVKAELVMDEGGYVTQNKIPGVTQPVALLGTSEKGFLNLLITAEANGGHSSFPEKETSIDILSRAIVKIRSIPFPGRIASSTHDMIEFVGPELPFFQKMVLANPRLFEKIIVGGYSRSPVGDAMMRTTVVPTIISGGVKENVIPGKATAVINLRLLPGDSVDWVIGKITRMINDNRTKITKLASVEASATTSVEATGYRVVQQVAYKTFDSTLVAPFLLIGGTDSKHFQKISPTIVRFSPIHGAEGFHGVNERVSLNGYQRAIWFYEQLIRDFN